MKKLTIADQLAKKSFESPSFQKSWQVHMQAFGPILEPAFVDDYQAKVHLAAALNKISSRDLKGALGKLKEVQKRCETNADKAVWAYFMGLCFEFAGAKDRMLELYQMANSFGHRFYLPYLKVAKSAHNDGVFDTAEEFYRQAIFCLAEAEDQQSRGVLASAWTNLCSCLIMMHDFDEAELALRESKELLPSQPGRIAAEAILRAAQGRKAQVEELLALAAEEDRTAMEQTRKETDRILAGTHPQFFPVPFETDPLDQFWLWFEKERTGLEEKLSRQEHDGVIHALGEALKPLAPFMVREPEFGIVPEDGKYHLELADFYAVALRNVYEELILRMPDSVKGTWDVTVIH